MATEAMGPAHAAGRMEELQRENAELRERLRRLATQSTAARSALQEAVGEREASARLAHQITVEERATRAALEVHGSNTGFSVVLQVLNLFVLLVLAIGLFVWLPREVERRIPAPPVQAPGGAVIIPGG
jgi:hypothetical protein